MKRKGQSVLEYVIMLTAIIAAVVAWISVFNPSTPSSTTGFGKMLKTSSDKISASSENLLKGMFPTK